MTANDRIGRPLSDVATSDVSIEIDRRALLLAAGTTVTAGLDVAVASKAKAATIKILFCAPYSH